jgi:hypothetical protein
LQIFFLGTTRALQWLTVFFIVQHCQDFDRTAFAFWVELLAMISGTGSCGILYVFDGFGAL